jgi:hypothetical protein
MKRTGLAIAAFLALAGCGGSGSGEEIPFQPYGNPINTFLIGAAIPVTYHFSEAGAFDIRVSGKMDCNGPTPQPVTVALSFSGSGSIEEGYIQNYTVPRCPSGLEFTQTSQITTTGEGPWQVDVLLQSASGNAGIAISDLQLSVRSAP